MTVFRQPLLLPLMLLVSACTTTGTHQSKENTRNDLLKAVETTGAPKVKVFQFSKLPKLGTARFPKVFEFHEGGWSGSSRVEQQPGQFAENEFWTINDRGLNLYLEEKDSNNGLTFKSGDRYFPLPHFNQTIFKISLNADGSGKVLEQLPVIAEAAPTNGLPSSYRELATGESGYAINATTGSFEALPLSPRGFDFEGVAQTFNRSGEREFWLVEEYGPSVLRADGAGNITQRWSPSRDHAMKKVSLPWVFRQRADNRGFEGVTVSGDSVLAALQSPIDAKGGPSGLEGHGNNATRIHRILRINRTHGLVEQFAYEHSKGAQRLGDKPKNVKIGDLAAIDDSGNRFLVLEHASQRKHIALFEATIKPETTRLADTNAYESGEKQFTPVETRLAADLSETLKGIDLPEKAEGISIINNKTIVLIFDNDHCIEPLLGLLPQSKMCENLAVLIGFPQPLFQ